MKAGRTLTEMAQELDRQLKAKKDFLVDTRALRMIVPDAGPSLTIENGANSPAPLAINDIAHRQVGSYLGIPAKYYDKMRSDYPELLAANVNGWFGKEPATRMNWRQLDTKSLPWPPHFGDN